MRTARAVGARDAFGPMSTRITGGSERGRRLRSPRAAGLRPTSEKVRAAIFSMIGAGAVEGIRVLDLYAGTGALGIEALSRGASWADLVESHAGRCRHIRESLRLMGLAARSHVYMTTVERALELVEGGYGLVLVDPPYDLDPWKVIMERLDKSDLLNDNALVVTEHSRRQRLAEAYGRLIMLKSRRHGDTSITIYRAMADNG